MVICRQCGEAEARVIRAGDRQIVLPCPECAEARDRELRERMRREEEARRRAVATDRAKRMPRLLHAAGVNVRAYGHCSFESFRADENPAALEAAQRFVERVLAGKRAGLVLFSRTRADGRVVTGNGKTHLAVAVVRALLAEPDVQEDAVVFRGVPQIVWGLRMTGLGDKTRLMMRPLLGATVLVLDDLGAEHLPDWVGSALYLLVEERVNRPLVITSNYSPDQLVARDPERMGRIVSRLAGWCQFVEMRGRDRRLDVKAE